MKAKNVVKIPPRAEVIKQIFVNTNYDLICLAKQFHNKQIYVGNCLIKPINSFAHVPIVNATHDKLI